MTIIPAASTLTAEASTVKLAEYAQAISVCECAFWGVRNSPCPQEQGCRDIWLKEDRDQISFYLAEAQEEIERYLQYFVGYKWVTDERHKYTRPVQANWGHVISGGVQGTTTISAGEAVSHAADPAVVGPIVTTVTDENEIHIFHPGEDVEIDPSSVTISGGSVTIEIPRCRMVKFSLADNSSSGLNYETITNFESTVDVKRIYNDTSTEATLERKSCGTSCTAEDTSACIYVRRPVVGSLDVPASSGLCGCNWTWVDLNYYSGIAMTKQARDAIIRLAHSKMPRNPCSCSPIQEFWRRDRNVPDVLTRERVNCPFGLADGAWIAWRWTQAMKLHVGATL